ncbi:MULTISPECIES: hypothetical protein [Kitasatospora]|uniref:Secreted protein n=1 Tax=Kitasatospora setae (strain ATCC 33774 / DSM 43861 / JCM 3304 / KCC A-0304 / NBRC 14216 / KM-6054) TaxID=452652 RepID=E4NDY2_KITSK|nr:MULTISPECIES: hypothetical protein [Kitasatospora]BAJ29413.1 hypothetical protein KSE_36090 [Kitasatospora setae KM-6054]
MNTALKVTVFTAGLAAAFTAAYGVGHAVGPAPAPARPHAAHAAHGAQGEEPAAARGDHQVGGLQIADRGYVLSLQRTIVPAGGPTELSFRVLAPDGSPLTEYRPSHEKELHLIVANRDLTDFQHLHPVRAADGTWTAPATLPEAGDYRVFADFTPAAETDPLTLGADLRAAGDYRPAALPQTGRTVTVDGYTLTLAGELTPGRPGRLAFTVSRDGRPVTDLDPYLAAYGHLVVLRAGDLGYLHVHPEGAPGDGATAPGPEVDFTATAPSPGEYRLFLDFRHGGAVHTAAFTLTAGAPAPTGAPASASAPAHQH